MLDDELKKFADTVIRNAKRSLRRQKKRASSDLLNSLDYELEVHKSSFSLQFFMMDYGTYVDEGVSGTKKKYNTPYSYVGARSSGGQFDRSLSKWIRQKGIKGRDAKGKFIKNDSLVYLIKRSIFRDGIKPTHFFTKPFQNAFKKLPEDLVEGFGLDIDDFLESVLNG